MRVWAAITLFVVVVTGALSGSATTCIAGKKFKVRQVCGHVADFQGASMPDAAVQINPKGQRNSVTEVRTDKQGNFYFGKLGPGEYEMRVKYGGFWDAWQNFELVQPVESESCPIPIRVVMKLAGYCSYVENAWKQR